MQLDMRAREARKKVISETAPLRRRAWLGGAILAALVFHMIKQLADLFGWFAPMKLASLLLGGMRNAALIVAIVACLNWAEIDLKYLTFDNVTWALTTIYDGAMKRAPIVIAIIAGGFVSLTALGYCIRGGKQRRR